MLKAARSSPLVRDVILSAVALATVCALAAVLMAMMGPEL